MKILFILVLCFFSGLGFSAEKSYLERLEKDLQEVAEEREDDAKNLFERVGNEARDLLNKGLNEVADSLNTLERKVRKMADEG